MPFCSFASGFGMLRASSPTAASFAGLPIRDVDGERRIRVEPIECAGQSGRVAAGEHDVDAAGKRFVADGAGEGKVECERLGLEPWCEADGD